MNRAPLILAIILRLLPVLYVGSYLALTTFSRYQFGYEYSAPVFWPLEQIDRKVRPGAWEWKRYQPKGGGIVGELGENIRP